MSSNAIDGRIAAVKTTPPLTPLNRNNPALAIATHKTTKVWRSVPGMNAPKKNTAPILNQIPPMNRM